MDNDETSPGTSAEAVVTSRHVLDLPTGPLAYRADAGSVQVRRDDGSALADVFYLAYRAEPSASARWQVTPFEGAPGPRPVTFAFNGGPGSASLWLNIGGFGPRRAPTSTPEHTPPAPYKFGDNPYTLLPSTDLVFIDAPGTGFSRLSPGAQAREAWGVDQDVDIFARAITRYLTITDSWQAPRYLFGESYGTARAAALVHVLQNQGLDFNGVILLSSVLNWATTQPGLDQGYVNLMPSLAAAAYHHGKAARSAEQDLDGFLNDARTFAATQYAQALQRGDLLPERDERQVARALSQYTGLDAGLLRKKRLRVEMEDFRRELLADEGKVIGRFDARFTAESHYTIGTGAFDPATDDAATAGVNSAHLSGFHRHLAHDLGYRSTLHYRSLYNVAIEGAWDWRHKAPGIDEPLAVPNVSLDLSAAMRRNPALRVLVMGGVFDLATPFAGAEFDISHLHLGPILRQNVQFNWYHSGHMSFVDEKAIGQMSADLRAFYAGTRAGVAGGGTVGGGTVGGGTVGGGTAAGSSLGNSRLPPTRSAGGVKVASMAGAFGMAGDIWGRILGTQPVPPAWEIGACAGAALLIIANEPAWHLTRNAITIAHEGGHAVISLLTGRKLEGIRLHADTSGVTYSRGRQTGPGMVATAAAGYVAPSVLGLAAAWLLATHHVTAMLWLLLALLVATFLAIRNLYGVVAVLVTAGAVFVVSYFASMVVQAAFGYATAWFLLLGGVRPVIELQRQRRYAIARRRPLTSDADQLARLTSLPAGMWVGVFALVGVAALVLGTWLLFPPSLLHDVPSLSHLQHVKLGG